LNPEALAQPKSQFLNHVRYILIVIGIAALGLSLFCGYMLQASSAIIISPAGIITFHQSAKWTAAAAISGFTFAISSFLGSKMLMEP
jgi:hypothetical protein